ncbi:MAG TPA: hypothetical protein VL119_08470 [Acidimicrobiia bacterium]|nr:hypothetical protein [Acidimicrobiia bacterium]
MSKPAKGRRRTAAAAGSRTRPAERRDWRRTGQVAVVWTMIIGLLAAIVAAGLVAAIHH